MEQLDVISAGVISDYTDWQLLILDPVVVSYTVSMDYMEPCWTFSLSLFIDFERSFSDFFDLQKATVPLGRIVLQMNNAYPFFHGVIDKQEIDSRGLITISGRDYRSILIDANVDPRVTLKANMDLAQAVSKLCEPFGVSADYGDTWQKTCKTVFGNGQVPGSVSTISDLKHEPNAGVYETIRTLCQKSGTTLLPGVTGNKVSLVSPTFATSPAVDIELRQLLNNRSNNILDGSLSRDFTNVPTYWAAYGAVTNGALAELVQLNADGSLATTNQTAIDSDGHRDLIQKNWIDDRIKPGTARNEFYKVYKPFILNDKESKTKKEMGNRLRRMIADRLKSAYTYECNVRNHTYDGNIMYFPDMLISVVDHICDVNERLWLRNVEFTGGGRRAPTTKLTMHRPGAMTLSE